MRQPEGPPPAGRGSLPGTLWERRPGNGLRLTRKERMIRMKKVWSIFCAGMLALALAACGGYPSTLPERQYKANCQTIPYETLSGNPEKYKNAFVKVTGRVVRVLERGSSCLLRVSVIGRPYEVYEVYVANTGADGTPQAAEGDIIILYGKTMGNRTYTTVIDPQQEIPLIYAGYIDL